MVTPQTLWSLNNRRAFDQAQALAARVAKEAGPEPTACVDRVWKLALGRSPTAVEQTESLALVAALAADTSAAALVNPPAELAKLGPERAAAFTKFCLAILNLNEFLFID